MRCKEPRYQNRKVSNVLIPCGQCLPCRINSRRVWTHRLILEGQCWPSNAFLTLTYNDDNLPVNGALEPEHHRLFINNLRTQYYNKSGEFLRFYMCGEYGDKSFRPHYHYALFNFPVCSGPGARWINRKYHPCACGLCAWISKVWGKGHIFMGKLELHSAQYVCGYVTKKMTKTDDERLQVVDQSTGEIVSLPPEFSRMSKNPGIAARAADVISAEIVKQGLGSVPSVLHVGGKQLPLGRYMKEKIYEKTGLQPLPATSTEIAQLQSMYSHFGSNEKISQAIDQGSIWLAMKYINAQKCLQTEQKFYRKVKQHEI